MKKLIAAAVAVAVIAPASVMAAGPTLYGKIHTSVDYKDNNGSGSANTKYTEWSLNSNSSRIGVKGSEDLGNGMKVGYLIEWSVDMDGDGSAFGERNRAVTLSGDWGTALAGKWDTPYKTVGRKLDLFGDSIGDTRNLSKNATTDNRAPNVVAYVTPNMGGFSATLAYVFDYVPARADNSDNDAWSVNGIYNNGPILVAAAYSDYSNPNGSSATAWRIGGAFSMGDFKVLGSYTDMSDQNLVKNNDPDLWTLGASYKMGSNTIKFQYSELDDSGLKDAAGSSLKDGADMWSLGLDHAMSKRTTVYAAYASTDNNRDGSRTSWNGGHDGEGKGLGVAGEKADSFSVGIIHKF